MRGTELVILAIASPLLAAAERDAVGSRGRARASLEAHSLIDCEPVGLETMGRASARMRRPIALSVGVMCMS